MKWWIKFVLRHNVFFLLDREIAIYSRRTSGKPLYRAHDAKNKYLLYLHRLKYGSKDASTLYWLGNMGYLTSDRNQEKFDYMWKESIRIFGE